MNEYPKSDFELKLEKELREAIISVRGEGR